MALVDTSEQDFESTVEQALVESGYRSRKHTDYDRFRCLDEGTLFDFIRATQMEMWEKLKLQHGEQVRERFLKRLVKEIQDRGALDVLRKGIIDLGCHFDLAYFKPETSLNERHQRLYNANVFSVIRQLHFSEQNDQSLDLCLFLNGIPIFTAELKNPAKGQTVQNAIQQYRKNRDPKEPLFQFERCLAHFAVDTDYAFMTTRLARDSTRFLPFNKGHENGAGNPPNPDGFRTAYLWEEVWQPDSILEIINHFVRRVDVLDEDGKPTGKKNLIFPRYHQLDAVRRLIGDAKAEGAGKSYLIEHSAGSGKSNTIAWLAHQLAGLHDARDKRIFDSVIVITDRRVLDAQLRQTVQSFEQTKGLVSAIIDQKSSKLAEALEAGKDIIVTTLQTFPFVTEKIQKMGSKTFAVLIDEAHSSQTGETTRSMKSTLSASSMEEAEQTDKEGETEEDRINAAVEEQMKKSGRLQNVSFFAFTATPKPKTLELFGRRDADGKFYPFSLYSMRQAIEEKFILDVLQNYTTFKVYFALNKRVESDPEYSRKKAIYLLKSYADLHEHAIRSKTEIMVEHFHDQVKDRIGGQAKAMVVTRSRLHAVRYKQMFDKVLKQEKLPYKALVAFSGTVRDPDTGEEFTESKMNGGIPESQTAQSFKQSKYRFLIVAEKFQTGFDQPLLHTMYVDKKLSGVNAVQTLSRLNRTHPDKKDTMVLDFTNDADDIQKSFQPYYETTLLTEQTDPNKLYDLKRKVEEHLLYQKQDVEAFAKLYFSKGATQQKLRAFLDPFVDKFNQLEPDQQEEFRKGVDSYVRLYSFLCHVIQFTDIDLEKTYQFLRLLRPLLPVIRERLPVEVTDSINMDSWKLTQTSSGKIALMDEDGELQPITELGTGKQEDEHLPLSEIVQYINEHYGTEFTDEDKVRYFTEDMERRMSDQQGLRQALDPEINPSEETRKLAFKDYFDEILEDMIDANTDIYRKIVEDQNFGDIFRMVMFKKVMSNVLRQNPPR